MAHSLDESDLETRSHLAQDPRLSSEPRLVAVWEGGSALCALTAKGKILIGRSKDCDLRVLAASVSREHALVRAGSPPTLEDLGSSNGTRVDGERLRHGARVALRAGRVIEIGSALLVLQDGQTAAPKDAEPLTSPDVRVAAHDELGAGAMERLYRLVDLVATGTISVILQGETGVGKEVFSRRIAERSTRSDKPFLKINCAAFAESMVESEVFGYERGAFTGAALAKPGLLESANGGTVFLDEVTELSLPMQAKLLRALGNREVMRVGSLKPRTIDVRFIAATNQDFQSLIAAGKFRADLYFRLNGITLYIPPLRERRSEILPLAERFIAEESARLGWEPPALADCARQWLLSHPWPGNVRELRNVIERATLLSERSSIQQAHLADAEPPAQASGLGAAPAHESKISAAEPPLGRALKADIEQLERERIIDAMRRCGGNQTRAAELLGLSRRALLNRLDAYALPRPRKRGEG